MGMIKGVIDKVASRKLAVTAAAGAAAATGTVELTLAYGRGSGGSYSRADGGVDTGGE